MSEALAEVQRLIAEDKNFIYSKKFNHSLDNLLKRYPEGAPTKVIAQVLLISEEEVDRITAEAVKLLRDAMKVSEE